MVVQFSGRRDGDAPFTQAAPLCWWIPPEAGGTAGTASAQEFAHGTRRPFLPPVLRRSLDRLGQPRRGIGEHSRAEDSTREAADRRAADSGLCGMRRHRGRVSLAPTGDRSRVITCRACGSRGLVWQRDSAPPKERTFSDRRLVAHRPHGRQRTVADANRPMTPRTRGWLLSAIADIRRSKLNDADQSEVTIRCVESTIRKSWARIRRRWNTDAVCYLGIPAARKTSAFRRRYSASFAGEKLSYLETVNFGESSRNRSAACFASSSRPRCPKAATITA